MLLIHTYIQRIVLATEETTVTQQVSHNRPIKCKFRLWSQKGTKKGQRVTSWCQPATQTNRDPNCDKKLRGSTSNGTDQYQNGSSNLLTPYREQARGKYIGFGLRTETGAERNTIIVDILDIIQQLQDIGIHLKVDEEQVAMIVSAPVSILNPNVMYLLLPLGVLYLNQNVPLFTSYNIITFLVF